MNRKILFLAISLLIASHTLFAQVRFGVKGGLNVSNVVFTNISQGDEYKYLPMFHFGGYVNWSLCSTMGLTGEVLYSVKGYKYESTSPPLKSTSPLQYLTIPILFNYQPIKNLSLQAGPEVGYLLYSNGMTFKPSNTYSNFDNEIDFSAVLGLNYSITHNINIGARYIHGLSSIFKAIKIRDDNGMTTGEKVRAQNRTIQVSLGYTFGRKA